MDDTLFIILRKNCLVYHVEVLLGAVGLVQGCYDMLGELHV